MGYRYTIDPIILSAQISPPPHSHILDIGCGCGIMPLILGFRHQQIRITGIEIQKELAEAAQQNIRENGMEERIHILNADINTLSQESLKGPVDLIISNPPYKKANTGRLNPDPGKALARHEISLTIDQLFSAAARILCPNGRFCLIFPWEREEDLKQAAAKSGFSMEWISYVHASPKKNPMRIIVSARNNPKEYCRVRPPIHLSEPDYSPTKTYQTLFNP